MIGSRLSELMETFPILLCALDKVIMFCLMDIEVENTPQLLTSAIRVFFFATSKKKDRWKKVLVLSVHLIVCLLVIRPELYDYLRTHLTYLMHKWFGSTEQKGHQSYR